MGFHPGFCSRYNGPRLLLVSYADCPAKFCPGIVIAAREMYASKTFDKPSRTWNLQCSVCLHKFDVAETELKSDDFSLEKLRQLYPFQTAPNCDRINVVKRTTRLEIIREPSVPGA